MNIKNLLALLLFSLGMHAYTSNAQRTMNKDRYEKEWSKADSLIDKGLPQSAIQVARSIMDRAFQAKDGANALRAQIFLMDTKASFMEGQDKAQIEEGERSIALSQGVEKAIWQSLTAHCYWNYYQSNLWKLLDRGQVSQNDTGDIESWDAPRLLKRASDLFQASLEQKALLVATPVEAYSPVIIEGKNTRALRPSMYDLLIKNALEYYKSDGMGLFWPKGRARPINDPIAFAPLNVFLSSPIMVGDTDSDYPSLAIDLYKKWLTVNLQRHTTDGLVDVDLDRLAYAHVLSNAPSKDSLFRASLAQLQNQYPSSPVAAQVAFTIAENLYQASGRPGPLPKRAPSIAQGTATRDLGKIRERLNHIVQQYPKTEGAANAANLLATIESESLSAQTEQVYLPGQAIKFLIEYRNVAKVHLRLYRIAPTEVYEYREAKEWAALIKGQTPIKAWQQSLPGTEDWEGHAAELKIDPVGSGAYLLLFSSREALDDTSNTWGAGTFQVSRLSFASSQTGQGGYVLDRATGKPITGCNVLWEARDYNRKPYDKASYKIVANLTTGPNGAVDLPKNDPNRSYGMLRLAHGEDTLYVKPFYRYSGTDNPAPTTDQTFFFTDRSIYRPGQLIYFKGILLKKMQGGRDNQIRSGQKTTVRIFDANDRPLQSLELIANEFGSFHGSFDAPEGVLNGQMRIDNGEGSVYFSVEEYKRPRFYVAIDSLKESHALNDTVRLSGKALAYAGYAIDGGQFRYRVVRKARFPYFWAYSIWGRPSSPDEEIAQGSGTTDASGNFGLSFVAKPDPYIDPEAKPVFTYWANIEVTDINGETRTTSSQVYIGYGSLQLGLAFPEDSKPADWERLPIVTSNMNGAYVPAQVQINIYRLRYPGPLRKRFWGQPDRFVYDEATFKQYFPRDEYAAEASPENWETGAPIFSQTLQSQERDGIEMPKTLPLENGWYLIEATVRDPKGMLITEKKYTHVWSPALKGKAEKALAVYIEKDSYSPGEELKIDVASDLAPSFYLVGSSYGPLDKANVIRKLKEGDRGGIGYSWGFIADNRYYSIEKFVDIPWSNKELQVQWASHRDKLRPGDREKWTLTVKGPRKEAVKAELLATLYDASLDAFKPLVWPWGNTYPLRNGILSGHQFYLFGSQYASAAQVKPMPPHIFYEKRYDDIMGMRSNYGRAGGPMPYKAMRSSLLAKESMPTMANADAVPYLEEKADMGEPAQQGTDETQVRKNLQETAFFIPSVQKNGQGDYELSFEVPDALTSWKLMVFAHTQDWETGHLEGLVQTQKELMVLPNLPRFLRQGDELSLTAKVTNKSDKGLSGDATLEIIDPETQQSLLTAFGLKDGKRTFQVAMGESTIATWNVRVPQSRYTPVIIRITARANGHSDGETHSLSVITNRALVTETMPFNVKPGQTEHIVFEPLAHINSSTLAHRSLSLEFAANPAWYAVQALPFLMRYPLEGAEQVFDKFYAYALADHILKSVPNAQKMFEAWNKEGTALLSPLEKNEALKTTGLLETPWTAAASDESENKRSMGALFNNKEVAKALDRNLRTLEGLQLADGSFPWFKGMYGDRYITQYIVTGLARMSYIQLPAAKNERLTSIVNKALAYLDDQMVRDHEAALRSKEPGSIAPIQAMYLYMRSFLPKKQIEGPATAAYAYYKDKAISHWQQSAPYQQAQIALALHRSGNGNVSKAILASLKERASHHKELGTYWAQNTWGYRWNEAPIEAQAALIEAFAEIEPDAEWIDRLKTWLLKQKQVQHWPTTKSTADACFALLLNGSNWLSANPEPQVRIGGKLIAPTANAIEPGTGYFKITFPGNQVTPEMADIQIGTKQDKGPLANAPSWGAIYWQYFEDMDKISRAANTPLAIQKQLFVERNTRNGPVLEPLSEGQVLDVGEKVIVRLVLRSDRDMEYVHVQDMRPAALEPTAVLSGYGYQGGLTYYQSTGDVATHYFIQQLPKGTYVLEYSAFAQSKGTFANGLATVQCYYAPSFAGHSNGGKISVH